MPEVNAQPDAVLESRAPLVGACTKDGERTITLNIVSSQSQTHCTFWVGLAKAGDLMAPRLLDLNDVQQIFAKAARQGVKDLGPLMLSDSFTDPARYIYLLPTPNTDDFREKSNWTNQLIETVKSWSPEQAGFYLAPELMPSQESHGLLADVLRGLFAETTTSDYFLLVGGHGTNTVLNSALRLKAELEHSEGMVVYVYH